jgi:hypothetical protein
MGRKVKYRNNEERIYMKVLLPLQNVVEYQEEILEVAEETFALTEEAGGNSAANAKTQVMNARKTVLFARKLLAAVKSCEPAICRGEEPTSEEMEAWERPLG